ncbi:hypothetical protein FRB93_006303 [Tulasnella sp. JGI-2019a]|nr:hypothetical protein FRB93_006303 [Tulasnella sp. JGI-2019a]
MHKSGGGPLCRDLRGISSTAMSWGLNAGDVYTPLLDLLIRPELDQVVYQDWDAIPSLVSTLALGAPWIRRLTIIKNQSSVDYTIFPKLEYLEHGGNFSYADYMALTLLPHLRVLRLQRISESRLPPTKRSTFAVFLSLRELVLFDIDIEFAEAVTDSVAPNLRTLQVWSLKHEKIIVAVNHFLETSPLLEDLYVQFILPWEELQLKRHERINRLQLVSLDHQSGETQGVELDWIREAFPELHDLTIQASPSPFYRARLTFRTFQSLVIHHDDHFRSLTVTLHVPTSSVPDIPPSQWNTSLRHLKFPWIAINTVDIDPFVKYLATLCPNVETLEIIDLFSLAAGGIEEGWNISLGDEIRDRSVKKFFEAQADGRTRVEIMEKVFDE